MKRLLTAEDLLKNRKTEEEAREYLVQLRETLDAQFTDTVKEFRDFYGDAIYP